MLYSLLGSEKTKCLYTHAHDVQAKTNLFPKELSSRRAPLEWSGEREKRSTPKIASLSKSSFGVAMGDAHVGQIAQLVRAQDS